MKRFCPFPTKWSPASLAVVVVPKKSEPPRGSVRHSAAKRSPRRSGATYRAFCSSVPCWMIASHTSSAPTPNTHAKM